MQVAYRQSMFVRMNMRTDASLLENGEYPFLVNGRVRTSVVSPIKSPVKLQVPSGKIQGLYGVANFLILFVDGKAYALDTNYSNSTFYQISGFQMSAEAPVIYVAAVPESFVNYERKAIENYTSTPINFGPSKTNPSPAVLVCQDGVSQPSIISPQGVARKTNNFNQWTVDNREYVPVGKQMLYFNGKLYVVSPDGRRIYHSVTGRPLDFVIVVDQNGNKIEGQDAEATSWSVNYEQITAIKELSTTKEEFMVCTERASYLVKPKYDTLFCGEPIFSTQFLFSTGAKNQFSVVDVLGDTVFIDFGGIKSFNSVLQTSTEGKNSPFSAIISRLFDRISQDKCCAVNHDNYALFSVNTNYGPLIVVFDTITNSFVSLDKYSGVSGTVTQFAEVVSLGGRQLYFSTSENDVYKAFSGPFEQVSVYIGDFSSKESFNEQILNSVKLIFLNVMESGTVTIKTFSDSFLDNEVSKSLISYESPKSPGLPFLESNQDSVRSLFATFTGSKQAWKVGALVSWSFQAELSMAQFVCTVSPPSASLEQVSQEFRHYKSNLPVIKEVSPLSGTPGKLLMVTGDNLLYITSVLFNDKPTQFTVQDSKTLVVVGPYNPGTYKLRFDTETGSVFYEKEYVCEGSG